MTKADNMAANLHALEKKVLPLIKEYDDFRMLVANSNMKEVEVMRAVQWLESKDLIKVEENAEQKIWLDTNGIKYLEKGLPESRLLKAISQHPKTQTQLMENTGLSNQEMNICIGLLKKRNAIKLEKDNELLISITQQGKKMLQNKSLEQIFLEKKFPICLEELDDEARYGYEQLKKRKKIIREDVVKQRRIRLTELGKEVVESENIHQSDAVDRLTPEMLKNRSWKGKRFRAYDLGMKVPHINYGKRHFVKSAGEYARKVWLELGFKEMRGPIVNSAFWNFDALFTAQDHPVRELQDTYYIEGKAKLPDKNLVLKVKGMHETGKGSGSTGWQYKWDEEDAKRIVMRTHTTVLSAKTLAAIRKEDFPAKFFAVGKCFRNETLDWSHLFEFNQFEGIVVDPDANFTHLLGYLKNFMKKIGFPKARFRPAYFPYTEPSVEIDAYHPVHKEWIELGGAGIFRPEVVIPLLGKDIPVLAWGPGLDRQMMEYYQINDIRELYKNDIKQLREMKSWIK